MNAFQIRSQYRATNMSACCERYITYVVDLFITLKTGTDAEYILYIYNKHMPLLKLLKKTHIKLFQRTSLSIKNYLSNEIQVSVIFCWWKHSKSLYKRHFSFSKGHSYFQLCLSQWDSFLKSQYPKILFLFHEVFRIFASTLQSQ